MHNAIGITLNYFNNLTRQHKRSGSCIQVAVFVICYKLICKETNKTFM